MAIVGGSARLALTYHYYPNTSCTASTCQLYVGYVSSTNGGSTWSGPTEVAGPMSIGWLPNTSSGRMFGDYVSTSILGGKAWPIIPVALAPAGSVFNQAMYAPTTGLAIASGTNAAVTGGTVAPSTPAEPPAHSHARAN